MINGKSALSRSSLGLLLSLLLAPAGVAMVVSTGACGGGQTPPAASPSASASASASAAPAASSAAPAASEAPSAAPSAAPAPAASPASKKATKKNDAAWASCHQSYKANNKEVAKDVDAMAKGCAKVTKMKLVGQTETGNQGDQDPPQSFPLKAEKDHCYRVYAQAAEGIKDLDLVIKDSTGAIAGEDSTDDPSPVVLEDGAVCFTEADAATVVVSVGMGKGRYAVQIWGD
jgi:pyruvate/2-oxoglutarate dehydrogenase complex dihydrolipoamide acyltransferase (E2) component